VERTQDLRKKFPLLIAGNLPMPGFESQPLTRLGEIERAIWCNSFLCLSAQEPLLPELLAEAQILGIPTEQILFVVEKFPSSFAVPTGLTVIEIHPTESAEDFRQRLTAKLESLRLGKLNSELRLAEKSFASIPEPAKQAAFERARFAHALAYLYELPPLRHSLCLRLAMGLLQPPLRENLLRDSAFPLELIPAEEQPWSPNLPFELVLALCASLALSSGGHSSQFREAFRARSSLLPFKVRNDLKTQVEKILEPLWGKNAA
jgi:hypothetical protein